MPTRETSQAVRRRSTAAAGRRRPRTQAADRRTARADAAVINQWLSEQTLKSTPAPVLRPVTKS